MALPWNRRLERRSPKQWLIKVLAGDETVVLNAHFGVRQTPDGLLATLENYEIGASYVDHVISLGVPGRGRLAGPQAPPPDEG